MKKNPLVVLSFYLFNSRCLGWLLNSQLLCSLLGVLAPIITLIIKRNLKLSSNMHTVTLTVQIRRPRKTNAVYLAKQPSHPVLSLGECFLLYRRAGFFFPRFVYDHFTDATRGRRCNSHRCPHVIEY